MSTHALCILHIPRNVLNKQGQKQINVI